MTVINLSELSIPSKPTTIHSSTPIIKRYDLIKHPEGGYYRETDRSPFQMISPYDSAKSKHYSTLIYYYLDSNSPIGRFHRNKSRIIHILQKGSGIYVLIHPDGTIESFKVGFGEDEKSQWVVQGGIYKASFTTDATEGLLISEVVVPGFDFDDHSFMSNKQELIDLVGPESADKLEPLGGWQ